MSDGVDKSGILLDALLALSPEQRTARLRAAENVDELVVDLADQAGRLVFSEVSKALEATTAVVALADELRAPRGRARARRARTQALAYAGRHDEALALCNEGLELAAAASAPVEAAMLRLASLHPLGELGRYDEAIDAGEAARVTLLSAGLTAMAARCDINLGGIHQNRDDPARALFHLDRAREALVSDPVLLGFIENNRGEALLLLSDFEGAEAAFKASLAASDRAQARLAAAIAEGNLADLAARRGFLSEALYYFEGARRRFEADAAGSHHARLLAEQAEALSTLGLTEDALAAYQQVIPQLESHGLAWEVARASAGLGRTLFTLGRLDAAAAALEKSAGAFRSLGQDAACARVELIRADLLSKQGHVEEAARLLEWAGGVLSDRPAELAAVRQRQARLALQRGALDEAQQAIGAALQAAAELDLAPLMADLLHLRGQLRMRRDEPELAVSDLWAAVQQVERVRGAFQADRFRAAYLGNRLAIYDDLVRAKLDRNNPRDAYEAFAVAEKAKSRSLLELTRGELNPLERDGGAGDARTGDPLQTLVVRLRAELNALYSQLDDTRRARSSSLAPVEWRAAVHARETELRAAENRLAARRSGAMLYAPPADADAVRLALSDDAALLEYYTLGDEIVLFLVTRAEVRAVRGVASLASTLDVIRRLQFQLTRAMRPGAAAEARATSMLEATRRELATLWQALIRPVADDLAAFERLIIVPHGPLHVVPFAALWDGRRYLLESHELVASPSASLFVHLRASQQTTGGLEPVVVGVPDEVAPAIAEEARRVASVIPGARVLLDDDATVQNVMKAAGRAGVLHLACHGRFSSHLPLASGLKLADRWMTVRDIASLRLSAELVVLSGCNTGRHVIEAGDELLGMLRGFFAAGAASILMSLWSLHDRWATELMARFYDHWRGGAESKSAALRAAQLGLLREQPHPVFWAPLVLVGKP